MTVYLILYLLIGSTVLLKYSNRSLKLHNVEALISFGLIFLTLALRHKTMGSDLFNSSNTGYLSSFTQISKFNWKQILLIKNYLSYEKGYIILNKLVSTICNNQQFFLIVCAFISIAPIAYIVSIKSRNPVLSAYIYMALPIFALNFSGLRQSIAIAICFYSIKYIEEKNVKVFILLVVAATFFHYSAFVFLIAYPLYNMPYIGKNVRILSVAVLLIIYLFRVPIFFVLSHILKESASIEHNGSVTLLIVFVLIYIFCFAYFDETKENNGYLNIFYVACFCQIFAEINTIAMRAGYYFMIFGILLIPNIISNLKDSNRRIVLPVVGVIFVIYGLLALRMGGFSMSYPYYFFWEMKDLIVAH